MANRQGYYNLPRFVGEAYSETSELRCLTVFIPDGDEYAAQLLTLMNVAGTKAAWFTDTDEQRDARANIWQEAYRATHQAIEEGCMDCEGVADCIENNEDVKNALEGFINTNWQNATTGSGQIPDSVANQNLYDQQDSCDQNAAWGMALATVQRLNRINEDFLETAEAITNNQELLAFVISAIPLIETLPVDEMLQAAEKISEWLRDAYLAGYDLDYEQARACEIFCLIQASPDCTLTFAQLRDFYWDKAREIAVFENAFESAITIIEAWANWDETLGEIVCDIMCAMQFGFLNFLNSAFGWSFQQFKLWANAGIPDDDWMTICEDCTFCYNTEAAEAVLISGDWVAGVPMRHVHAASNGALAQFNFQFLEAVTLASYDIEFQSLGSGTTTNTRTIQLFLGATLVGTLYSNVAGNGGYTWQHVSGSGTGQVFDRMEIKDTHVGKRPDIRGEVCVLYGAGGGGGGGGDPVPPAAISDCGCAGSARR